MFVISVQVGHKSRCGRNFDSLYNYLSNPGRHDVIILKFKKETGVFYTYQRFTTCLWHTCILLVSVRDVWVVLMWINLPLNVWRSWIIWPYSTFFPCWRFCSAALSSSSALAPIWSYRKLMFSHTVRRRQRNDVRLRYSNGGNSNGKRDYRIIACSFQLQSWQAMRQEHFKWWSWASPGNFPGGSTIFSQK